MHRRCLSWSTQSCPGDSHRKDLEDVLDPRDNEGCIQKVNVTERSSSVDVVSSPKDKMDSKRQLINQDLFNKEG